MSVERVKIHPHETKSIIMTPEVTKFSVSTCSTRTSCHTTHANTFLHIGEPNAPPNIISLYIFYLHITVYFPDHNCIKLI